MIEIDFLLFRLINSDMAHPLLDWLMPVWRNGYFWAPFYAFLLALLVVNFQKKGLPIFIGALITFGISDQVSSHVIKPAVQRERPCNDMTGRVEVRQLIPCGSGKSFPSSHASNHFALAAFLGVALPRMLRRMKPWLYLWAASVGFAQVYVGVHYPFDIIGGASLGIVVGLAVGLLERHIYIVVAGQLER